MAGASTRGPLGGRQSSGQNIKDGTSMRSPTPGRGSVGRTVLSGGQQSLMCEIDVPVIEVDLDKMSRLLYSVSYAEAADRAASRDGADVDLGDQKLIEASARDAAEHLMVDLFAAIEQGPEALAAFIRALELRREKARASLKQKLDDALKAGRDKTDRLGYVVKFLSSVKFVSTVTVKTVSLFTGGAGFALDVAYTGTKAGVEQWLNNPDSQTVHGVVVTESLKEVGEEVAESLNELVAKGIMTKAEKNQLEGLLGNYKGNAEKLAEQIGKLEKHLERALSSGKAKKVAGLTRDLTAKLARLKALRIKTVQSLVGKNAVAASKKALGRTLSVVFLASEVKDAWKELDQEWEASN